MIRAALEIIRDFLIISAFSAILLFCAGFYIASHNGIIQ
jgi:hypothetical protein